jgi:aromatic ring-opening dioxygenase catalytic subunit (LigB family)
MDEGLTVSFELLHHISLSHLPGPGLDHGVFVPFKFMFGDRFQDVPIVQASIDGTLDPDRNFKLGKAVEGLR